MMQRVRRLLGAEDGATAVETALALPVLLLLGLGAAQATELVTQQSRMQAAGAQAEQIIAATKPKTAAQLTTIQSIIKASAGMTAEPTVEFIYRCGTDTTTTTTEGTCGALTQWTYVHVRLAHTFTPGWTEFGIGAPIDLVVDRTAQIS